MAKSILFKRRFVYLIKEMTHREIHAELIFLFSTRAKLLDEHQMLALVDYYNATDDIATIIHDVFGMTGIKDPHFVPKIPELS